MTGPSTTLATAVAFRSPWAQVTSDLPPASGMSSSSALLCAVALALADLNGFSSSDLWRRNCPDPLALAGYLACVENGRTWGELAGSAGVGTFGGSEDHTAMLCGSDGSVIHAEFDPPRIVREVALPDGLALVVAVSGVLAEKSGAALADYNRASLAISELLTTWNAVRGRADASLAGAVRSLVGDTLVTRDDPRLAPLTALAQGYQRARLEQFVAESFGWVPRAVEALASGDLAALGDLAAASQGAAAELLGNQVPETRHLAGSARRLGALAASAFGAGYGGSVWALMSASDAEGFGERWLDDYHAAFPGRHGTVLVTRPGPPARREA